MRRIVLTSPDGRSSRVIHEEGEFFGPIPPESGEFLPIYERLVADGVVPEAEVDAAPRVLPAISHRQFFQALAEAGMITRGEALAAVKAREIPPAMAGVLAALPPEGRFAAEMLLAGATVFERDHPLVALFGDATGKTAAELDQLWRAAATL